MKFLFILLSLLVVSCNSSQESVQQAKTKALADAQIMAKALIEYDFKTLAEYTHPMLLEEAGGKEKYIQNMTDALTAQKQMGNKFEQLLVTDPSEVFTCNGELQCVLKHDITMSVSEQQTISLASNLLGVSKDNGNSWVFLNIGNGTLEQLRKTYPDLCDGVPVKNYAQE